MNSDSIKRSEILHFSQVSARSDVLELEPEKQAELVEWAMTYLYRVPEKSQREDILALINTIMQAQPRIADLFKQTAYTVCDRRLVIVYVNKAFLERSGVKESVILGRSLYYEREYEGTSIEQLYSMVMETRLIGDALVRYEHVHKFDGWFAIVVLPMDEGGIGVLSRFSKEKAELAGEIDFSSPDAPRFVTLQSEAPRDTAPNEGASPDGTGQPGESS